MSKKLKRLFRIFIYGYIILSVVSLIFVYRYLSSNVEWMSFSGSFLGGILGGLATLIAIYFTIISLKQDSLAIIIPMRTMLYGYYKKEDRIFVSSENINEDNHTFEFNPFNTNFMKFANVGKDSAVNIQIEWCTPYESDLYDILLGYGISNSFFEENFDLNKKNILYTDYMLPIKNEPENYKVQISDELIILFRYIMSVFVGNFKEYAISDKVNFEFGNNFINKKHKFTTVKIKYEDINGNCTEEKFDIYCRIQELLGTYNGGYEKLQIELSTSKIVN